MNKIDVIFSDEIIDKYSKMNAWITALIYEYIAELSMYSFIARAVFQAFVTLETIVQSYLGNAMVYWTMKPTCIIYAADSWEFVNCWQNTGEFFIWI